MAMTEINQLIQERKMQIPNSFRQTFLTLKTNNELETFRQFYAMSLEMYLPY